MLLQLFRLTWKALVASIHISVTTSYRRIKHISQQRSPFVYPLPWLLSQDALDISPSLNSCLLLYTGEASFSEFISINCNFSPNLVHLHACSSVHIACFKQKSENLNLNGSSPIEEFRPKPVLSHADFSLQIQLYFLSKHYSIQIFSFLEISKLLLQPVFSWGNGDSSRFGSKRFLEKFLHVISYKTLRTS